MLIKLYELPEECTEYQQLKKDIDFRRPLAAEKYIVNNWVRETLEKAGKVKLMFHFQKIQFQHSSLY